MLSKQPVDLPTVTIRGRTLNEALANVKKRYGPNAQIVESREVKERSIEGLGETRLVEIVVALNSGFAADDSGPAGMPEALAVEVARIESLVQDITRGRRRDVDADAELLDSFPLTRELLLSGVSRPAVRQIARTWRAEGGAAEPRQHLASLLPTSGGTWETIGGRHLVLGRPGSGKTTLVLGTAATLRSRGQRVLILALGPRHKGDVRQLQEESRLHGYDAAILRRGDQIVRAAEHFKSYDAVIIDTPALGTAFMSDPAVQVILAGDENMHRHLAVPLDSDQSVIGQGWLQAKEWNCDWIAPTRLDLIAHKGKLIDVLMAAPCPVSLLGRGPWPGPSPVVPSSAQLVESVLVRQAKTTERHLGLSAKAREV